MCQEKTEQKESSGIRGLVEDVSGEILLEAVTSIPHSPWKMVSNPREVSELLIEKASMASALQSGLLALPSGPLGLLTILPDLINIWRIQSQLVADIAACHGRIALLGRQEMAWCLFRHAATQIARDFLVRSGQRALAGALSKRAMVSLLRKAGSSTVDRLAGRWLMRIVPLLGMGIAAGYAWWDTREVGRTALELFSSPEKA